MFYELYEKIEERGLETVLQKYSRRQRDLCLSRTPDDELVMYSIIGLTPEEMGELFSRSVLMSEFERLPASNLFYSFDLMRKISTTRTFRKIFLQLSTEEFLYEYRTTPYVVFQMLDSGLILIEDVIGKLQKLSIGYISSLKRLDSRFERVWSGCRQLLMHCVFPVKTGSGFQCGQTREVRQAAMGAYSRDISRMIVEYI